MSEKLIEGACGGKDNLCDNIKELAIRYNELKEQHDKLADMVDNIAEEMKNMLEFQGGTKVYVEEIKEQLGRMEDRLFTFMGDLVKNLTKKEAEVATTAAKENTQKWDKTLTFLKDALKLLLAALAGYLTSKGGR